MSRANMSSVSLLLVILMVAHNAGVASTYPLPCPLFPPGVASTYPLPCALFPPGYFPVIYVSTDFLFEGDPLSIRCWTSSYRIPNLQFAFYKNYYLVGGFRAFNEYRINSAQLNDSGDYYCEVDQFMFYTPKRSAIKHIQIYELFSTPQMKVTPYRVVKGDLMTLICETRAYRENTELWFTFYRDGREVQSSSSSNKYERPGAHLGHSGRYRCKVSARNGVSKSSQEQHIQIQELFSTPEIKKTPYKVVEGDLMTLTCHTSLNPYRKNRELQFTFYRDEREIQRRSSSEKYELLVTDLGYSGSYKCKVSTRNDVHKSSQEEYIQIQELFSTPKMRLDPDQIVEGDLMTLMCDTSLILYRENTELQFTFYKDWRKVQGPDSSKKYERPGAHLGDSGRYSCKVSTRNGVSKSSQQETIQVQELFSAPEIKKTPYKVVEGDLMTLTCHTSLNPYRENTELQFTFYRDEREIQKRSSSEKYELQVADLGYSGSYKCKVSTINDVHKSSQEEYIQIQELFSTPKMRLDPDQIVEGDLMTLMCDTSLILYRENTELQFTFYKDRRKVQGPDSSKKYERPGAHLGDSGRYSCKVSTRNGVSKSSQPETIQVQELFSAPEIKKTPYKVVEGDLMTLTCHTSLNPYRENTELQFTFYRDEREIQRRSSSEKYDLQVADLGYSGSYKCKVSTINDVHKSSQEEYIQIQELFSAPQITVVQPPVVEGYNMTLLCDTRLNQHRKTTELQFTFYRDGKMVQGPGPSEKYERLAALSDSGRYRCEISNRNGVNKSSEEENIQIEELFSPPKITLNSSRVVEGGHVALTCNTSLNPHRPSTDLKFAFYRDGQKIQDFKSLNNYEILSAQSNNSGEYSCEVSASNTLKKDSQINVIQVQEHHAG